MHSLWIARTMYETVTAPHDTRAFSLFDRNTIKLLYFLRNVSRSNGNGATSTRIGRHHDRKYADDISPALEETV